MKSITLRNIPPEIYSRLELRAVQTGRSLNCEIIAILETTLTRTALDTEALLAQAQKLRAGISVQLDEKLLRELKKHCP